MKCRLLIILFLLCLGVSNALYEDLQTGARALGMGDALVALSSLGEAPRYNVAGLASIESPGISTYYKSLYGGISGLHNMGLTFYSPFKGFGAALSIYETGVSLEEEGKYSEKTLTLSAAKFLREDVALGLNINLYRVSHPRFGSSNIASGIDIGVLGKLYDKWKLGFFVENIKKPVFHGERRDYDLGTAFNFGVAFMPYERARSSISVRKEEDFPARVSFGEEIDLLRGRVSLRVGLSHEESLTKFSFGFSVRIKNLNLDYGAQIDPNLPMTHIIGINLRGIR